jgi:hypothetical protein
MFKSRKVAKNDSWTGTVVDKSRNMPDGSNMYHYIKVSLANGETRKFRIDRTLWNGLSVGDTVVKKSGADLAKS